MFSKTFFESQVNTFYIVSSPTVSSLLVLGSNSHQLVGLLGLLMAIGKVFAGIVSLKLSNNLSYMAIMGMVSHTIAIYISFLYLPTESITHDTWDIAYLPPSEFKNN
jgi:hypothetical protein